MKNFIYWNKKIRFDYMQEIEKKIKSENKDFEPPLDKGIERAVLILRTFGIETYESCEGGKGHAFPEPTICFEGEKSDGFKAFAVAIQHQLRVSELRRVWDIIDEEPVGPVWKMTFY